MVALQVGEGRHQPAIRDPDAASRGLALAKRTVNHVGARDRHDGRVGHGRHSTDSESFVGAGMSASPPLSSKSTNCLSSLSERRPNIRLAKDWPGSSASTQDDRTVSRANQTQNRTAHPLTDATPCASTEGTLLRNLRQMRRPGIRVVRLSSFYLGRTAVERRDYPPQRRRIAG